jgi:hypothetical protein
MAAHGLIGHRPRRRRGLTRLTAPPRPRRTWWGGCSTPTNPMSPGAVISPTSPPTRAGCIWRRSSTWPPATCSAGRWTTATTLAWSLAPWRRPPLPVVVTGWTARSSTPTAAANTPRPPASTSASGWGCGGPWAAPAPAWITPSPSRSCHPQGRAGRPLPLPHPRPGARLDLPLDRLVQPPSASLHQRLPTAAGVGTAAPSCPPATVNPGRIATVPGQRGRSTGACASASWSSRAWPVRSLGTSRVARTPQLGSSRAAAWRSRWVSTPKGGVDLALEHGHGGCSVQTATVGWHRPGLASPRRGRTVRGHARRRTGF